MKKEYKFRPAPLTVISYLYPYLGVLIIPALRGVFVKSATPPAVRLVIGFSAAVVFAAVLATIKYRTCRIVISGGTLIYSRGLFYRVSSVIPVEKIALVMAVNDPFCTLFHTVRLKIYTEAKGRKGADMTVLVSRKNARRVMSIFDISKARLQYKPGFLQVIINAAATSSAWGGLVIAAPIIRHTGNILGRAVDRLIIDKVSEASRYLPDLIPQVAGAVSLFLVLLYAVAFLAVLVFDSGFRVYENEGICLVRAGVMPRRAAIFRLDDITAVVNKQNLFMHLLGRISVNLSIGGMGKNKGESAVILPAVTKREANTVLSELMPRYSAKRLAVKAEKSTVASAFLPPVVIFAVILPVRMFTEAIFPKFSSVTEFLALTAVWADALYLYCRTVRHSRGGFTLDDGLYCVGGALFGFESITASAKDIEQIVITRYFANLNTKLCRVTFKIRNKNRDSVGVFALDRLKVTSVLYEKYGLN